MRGWLHLRLALALATLVVWCRCNEDCRALNATGFASQLGWHTGASDEWCCTATGVTCDTSVPRRVTALSIGSKHLSGSIPPSLANLTRLTSLILHTNSFKGTIEVLAPLTRLTHLNIGTNELVGDLRGVAHMTLLTYLHVDLNNIGGSLDVRDVELYTHAYMNLWGTYRADLMHTSTITGTRSSLFISCIGRACCSGFGLHLTTERDSTHSPDGLGGG
jgi:hypothetical protein